MEDRLGWTRAVPASLDLWPVWTCHVHLSRPEDVEQLATAAH
ncbi:MAG: hypothetical protein ACM3OA_11745 [Acidobacteriota bacterium]